MKKLFPAILAAVSTVALLVAVWPEQPTAPIERRTLHPKKPSPAEKALARSDRRPNDWFYMQRA
ncbi:MAG TPA: hypothetical protein VN285_06070 [Candidatus Deferrimicrobium sp.]|nr:hypothetical protein [Candidatus Deferrimicrobium sp.]